VVDAIRVTRLLRSLDQGLGSLARRQEATPAERKNETWLLAVKYLFVTTIEACIDIAQHLCSTESLGTPADNGDAIRRIGDAGIIKSRTASAMVSAVGFRNVLVHEYVEVDDRIVIDRLQDHHDLSDFALQVSDWMSRRENESPRSGLN
jgi:uncharacterized protein YutE (UPF0331/DUF86 family)